VLRGTLGVNTVFLTTGSREMIGRGRASKYYYSLFVFYDNAYISYICICSIISTLALRKERQKKQKKGAEVIPIAKPPMIGLKYLMHITQAKTVNIIRYAASFKSFRNFLCFIRFSFYKLY
jgi:hypothetical protein